MHVLRCYAKKKYRPNAEHIHEDVIVSLTTTPVRIKKIWPTINSILLQSEKPAKIYLWLPKQFKRFPQTKIDVLPDFIQSNPHIQVMYIDKDFGPATKLLPCLQTIIAPETKIIVIDDDRIYAKHLIRDLLNYERSDQSAAIGIAGSVLMGTNRSDYRGTKKIAMVDVILGYHGYLVKPKFFSNAVFEYPNNLPEAFFEDDVWFSGHLERMKVRRVLIPTKKSTQNLLTSHKATLGLCKFENSDQQNFMNVFNHFRQGYQK